LAVALNARQCELVKHHGGVFTADPKVVSEARVLPLIGHHFLTALAAAGAKVIAYRAAAVAEEASVSLRFSSLHDRNATEVIAGVPPASSIALRSGRYRFTGQSSSRVTLEQRRSFLAAATSRGVPAELELADEGAGSRIELLLGPDELELGLELARGLLPDSGELALLATGLTSITVLGVQGKQFQLAQAASGAQILRTTVRSDRIAFLVPDADAHLLARALHTTLLATSASQADDALQFQDSPEQRQRIYVGHR
jgi:aspartate kinase